jgi:hypothetical protein
MTAIEICFHLLVYAWSRGGSVSIVSDYGLDDRAIEVRSRAEAKEFFPLASVSRPALGSTQPPVQWIPGVFSLGLKRGRTMTLTIHPHLLPRSWMSRSYTFSLPCSSIGVLNCHTFSFFVYARSRSLYSYVRQDDAWYGFVTPLQVNYYSPITPCILSFETDSEIK